MELSDNTERDKSVMEIIAQRDELLAQEPIDWPAVYTLTQEMRRLVGLQPQDYRKIET